MVGRHAPCMCHPCGTFRVQLHSFGVTQAGKAASCMQERRPRRDGFFTMPRIALRTALLPVAAFYASSARAAWAAARRAIGTRGPEQDA
jgi:hypothetical protein